QFCDSDLEVAFRKHLYFVRDTDGVDLLKGKRKPRKGQNRIKTGQKREACRSREKFKAVAVNRGRKAEQNTKRMTKNANAVKSYSSFKKKEEKRVKKGGKPAIIYFSAIPRDGIFEIDLSNSYTNESSIYAVSKKRAKLYLDSALLWHCCLAHISKKCIEKLQHDGLLNSTDLRAFENCVSCMSGKMARKPYTHQVEKAKDLLGLIHTDVCGPFKIMSRQRASYFVTFTDDFSRYGYVYLLKHKHEVFETFKVFQKEVKNQLDHGIITHRTLSYTPQHNGVSKRRNITLLDMVRSMMSQITLPKSFWDYALKTAARILNMVPTKKVEKTPYKVLVELPPNGKTIGSKWLFKKKTDMYGVVHTYKVCLMAKGYTQTPRIDYEETFSLVVDIRVIRILIAIAAYYDYEIWQIDVKTSFLNGYLNEEVYMEQPEKLKLSKSQGASTPAELKRMQNVPYALLWVLLCDLHWTTVKNILKYLRNTKDMFLVYGGDLKRELRVSCYTDAGYLTDADDLKSYTGYVFVLNGGAVDWKSAKQSICTTSSTEAEYIAAFDASKEAVWLGNSFLGLVLFPQLKNP
nr:hypothetical protein [Tanacetum cinerariifolium]